MHYPKTLIFVLAALAAATFATTAFADSVSPTTVTEGSSSTYVLVDCTGASGGNVIANLFSSSGTSVPIDTYENAMGVNCQISPHLVSVPANLDSGTYYIDVYSASFLIADGTETRSTVEASAGFVESFPITVVGNEPEPTPTPELTPTPTPEPTSAPVPNPVSVPVPSGGSSDTSAPTPFNAGLLSAGSGLDTGPVVASSPSLAGQVLGASTTAPHPDGTLVLSGQTVYLIRSGERYAFRNAAEFETYGYSFSQVVPANSGDLVLPFTAQNILKAKAGSVILDASDRKTVYIIGENGSKQGFTSARAFSQHGYSFAGLPVIDLSDYPPGPVIAA